MFGYGCSIWFFYLDIYGILLIYVNGLIVLEFIIGFGFLGNGWMVLYWLEGM